jgi:hypothetical protein
MRLKAIDIKTKRRLSLRDVKLSVKEDPKPITLHDVKPITPEELLFSSWIKTNPALKNLVETFDLRSCITGDKIRVVDNPPEEEIEVEVLPEPKIKREIDKSSLDSLIRSLIDEESNYSKEQIIDRIRQATEVSQERAERGFNLLVSSGAIEITPIKTYNLRGSTPF